MTSITPKAQGHSGSKNSLVANGVDPNDRKTNGLCRADITSTTWAKNTKSGTLSFVPACIHSTQFQGF